MKKFSYKTPVGKIWIAETDNKISHISFFELQDCEIVENEIIKKCYGQLCEYFEGKRKTFDLPLYISGTEFQMKVWKALQDIGYARTASYGDIAKIVGNPKASRAIGMANNRNKIPIIIPCHRIIGSNGDLTGYAGGLSIKKYLLDLEQRFSV